MIPPQTYLFGDFTVPVGVMLLIMGYFVIKALRNR